MFEFRDTFNFDRNIEKEEPEIKESCKVTKRRRSECITRTTNQIYRRAFSETQLLDLLPEGLKKGNSYNFITAGDVDALSFFKVILRQCKTIDYMFFSTWCMACEDILQIEEWLQEGRIKKVDAYVGEIFPGSYKQEWKKLHEVIYKYGGRIAVFKNHSKIFAGYSGNFYFAIQTSANINTNPRTENGCITIDKGLYQFYKDYFDKIESFNKMDKLSEKQGENQDG